MVCAVGALLYYGWPLVEAFLVLLPLPDPKFVVFSVKKWYTGAKNWLVSEKKPQEPMHGYMQDFSAAPGTLGDNDDDSEDVGHSRTQSFESTNLMNYDSDDAGREEGAEASELI